MGTEFAGGGLSTALRDMARVGEMMRLDGKFNGQQIGIPGVAYLPRSSEQFALASDKRSARRDARKMPVATVS